MYEGTEMSEKKIIITIGRQTGSGGREIGSAVAQRLGIRYFDSELLERAARESGLAESLFETHDEKPTNSFLYSLVMDGFGFGGKTLPGEVPLDQTVFLAQFNTIKKIAEEGSCVMVGRCADFALEDDPDLFSVFLHADLDFRAARIASEKGITDAKAREFILKTDKKRGSYYNYYTNNSWGAAITYDLCLNSSKFGIDECVDIICNAVMGKSRLNDDSSRTEDL